MVFSFLDYTKYLAVLAAVFIFSSCEKIFLGDDPADEPIENFEIFWNELDKKYAFFTYKGIDWQEVYLNHRPLVNNQMTQAELFEVLQSMVYSLNDGHTTLTTPFDVARNWSWYLNSPPNYNFDIIEREYLGEFHHITGPFLHTIIDSVGYVHYRSFSQSISRNSLSLLLQWMQNTKGLIIDVRNNGGGDTRNAERLAAVFTSEEILTQYWLYKNGPGHDDFSHPEPRYLIPDAELNYSRPVVVLTNRKCYSATNDFVLIMRSIPGVTILGDTTGGGGGLPFNSELPNGWQYRFSTTMTIAPDGFNVESGIPPDVNVQMDPAEEANDEDTIIDAAIQLLNE
jgi:hypothetical protein